MIRRERGYVGKPKPEGKKKKKKGLLTSIYFAQFRIGVCVTQKGGGDIDSTIPTMGSHLKKEREKKFHDSRRKCAKQEKKRNFFFFFFSF